MKDDKSEKKKPEGRSLISYITVISVFIFFLISLTLLITTYFITIEYMSQEIEDSLDKTMRVVEHVFKDDVNEIDYVLTGILTDRNIEYERDMKKKGSLENELKKVMGSEIGKLIDFLIITGTDYRNIAKISHLDFNTEKLKSSGYISKRWKVVNYGTSENPEVYIIKRESIYDSATDKLLFYLWVGIDLKRNRKLIEEIVNQSNVSDFSLFYGDKMLISYNSANSSEIIKDPAPNKTGYSNPMSNVHQYSSVTDIFDSGGNLRIKFSVISDRSENIRKTYLSLGAVLITVLIITGLIVIFFIHKVIRIPLKRLINCTEIDLTSQVSDPSRFYGAIKEFNEIAIAIEMMIEKINVKREVIIRAQRAAKIGSWQLEVGSQSFECSRQLHLILGKEEECAANFDQFLMMMDYDKSGIAKKAIDEALRFGIEKSFDHEINTGDKMIWAHHIISIMNDSHGKPFKIIGTVQDITERKRILEELALYRDNLEIKVLERTKELSGINSILKAEIKERKAIEEDLIKAKKAADEANVTKTRFLANMSHEIRTPMNSIIGYIDLSIQSSKIDPEIRENLLTASNSAGSLMQIINDILDISKMEEGKLELVKTRFSLNRMINKILTSFQVNVIKKGLSLRLINNPVLSKCYVGDEIRITQILINLIGNAVKFTNKGGITVRVESVKKNRVLFEIEDTGIGISSENIEKIMEPFSQEDISSSRKFGGIGLGTSISRQLVHMMNGELKVESTPGKGSMFGFEIELVEDECEDNFSSTTDQNGNKTKVGKISKNSCNILLAEDVPANAKLAELRLGHFGHSVTHVWNGEEVIERLKNESFDIVLMDVQMPVMDGLMAVKEIRELEKRKIIESKTPVIALTANVMKEDILMCMDAGMDGVVAKPVNFEFLVDEIDRLVAGDTGDVIDFSFIDEKINNKFDIKGVNLKKGLNLWKEEKLYFESLNDFFTTNIESINELKRSIKKSDFENGSIIIHRLKGITGNLALDDIYSLCIVIEENIKAKDKEKATALLGELSEVFLETSSSVSSLFEAKKEEIKGETAKLDDKKLASIMKLLIDAIEQNELVVAEIIIEGLSDQIDKNFIERTKDALKHFDFGKVIEETKKIADKLNIYIG